MDHYLFLDIQYLIRYS